MMKLTRETQTHSLHIRKASNQPKTIRSEKDLLSTKKENKIKQKTKTWSKGDNIKEHMKNKRII